MGNRLSTSGRPPGGGVISGQPFDQDSSEDGKRSCFRQDKQEELTNPRGVEPPSGEVDCDREPTLREIQAASECDPPATPPPRKLQGMCSRIHTQQYLRQRKRKSQDMAGLKSQRPEHHKA